MCKGLTQGNTSSFCLKEGTASPNVKHCELCNSKAALYCQADDAYLCRKCDKWVHEANFLALRHIRCFLCNSCQNLTQRYLIGASHEVVLPTMSSGGGKMVEEQDFLTCTCKKTYSQSQREKKQLELQE
ncbi:Zinc finger, B-box [Corchorus olitorius]|uniref:Zinc finger, B-box n=1 Tax=Corchorus olitorius TaxID=93759 RepID=A0A1R3JYS2_9ROSI|nr:Zinc finger, B-box [Corchorus olitorius]